MTVALVDNGSLEPAAHRNLRAMAVALSQRCGVNVHAVSWKHSDRIPLRSLPLAGVEHAAGASVSERTERLWTLAPFVRAHVARGEREFVFVPFFISPQGAIGSALRHDLEELQRERGGFEFSFTEGLVARGVVAPIVASCVRETLAARPHIFRSPPPVIVADHGGPSVLSALVRDELATRIGTLLGAEIGPLAAASMEGIHRPLLAEQLRAPGFAGQDVIVALLFLSPGRHAGPGGDTARICAAADARCHFTALVGTHPLVVPTLAAALQHTLSTFNAPSFA